MYQRIFVPVDGGAISRLSLDEAIALARFTKGRIHLMHVVDDLPIVTEGGDAFITTGSDIMEMADEGGKQILAAAQAAVQGHTADFRAALSAPAADHHFRARASADRPILRAERKDAVCA